MFVLGGVFHGCARVCANSRRGDRCVCEELGWCVSLCVGEQDCINIYMCTYVYIYIHEYMCICVYTLVLGGAFRVCVASSCTSRVREPATWKRACRCMILCVGGSVCVCVGVCACV